LISAEIVAGLAGFCRSRIVTASRFSRPSMCVYRIVIFTSFVPQDHLDLGHIEAFLRQPCLHHMAQIMEAHISQSGPDGGTTKPFVDGAIAENLGIRASYCTRLQHGCQAFGHGDQAMPLAVDREEDFVQVPFVAWLGTSAPQLIGIRVTELPTPLADGLIGDEDPTDEQQRFDIAIAEAGAEIQPYRTADDLGRKAVVFVAIRWFGVFLR
jgi:hypothetical protein